MRLRDDDPVVCERTSPTLTSIRLDFNAGGYLCAELLDRAIADRRRTSFRLKFEPMYVVHRLSTCRVTNVSPRVRKAVEFIRLQAKEVVDVAAVVAVMGCSRRLAELRFREETGHTIYAATTRSSAMRTAAAAFRLRRGRAFRDLLSRSRTSRHSIGTPRGITTRFFLRLMAIRACSRFRKTGQASGV